MGALKGFSPAHELFVQFPCNEHGWEAWSNTASFPKFLFLSRWCLGSQLHCHRPSKLFLPPAFFKQFFRCLCTTLSFVSSVLFGVLCILPIIPFCRKGNEGTSEEKALRCKDCSFFLLLYLHGTISELKSISSNFPQRWLTGFPLHLPILFLPHSAPVITKSHFLALRKGE